MKCDLWCARNLGFLSIVGTIGVIFILGPILILLVFFIPISWLDSLSHTTGLPLFLKAASGIISLTLLTLGAFLLLQYFRYPRLHFKLTKTEFWLLSSCYVPSWTIPIVLSLDYPVHLPNFTEVSMTWLYLGAIVLIFPICHTVLSIVGLLSTRKFAEQGAAANP